MNNLKKLMREFGYLSENTDENEVIQDEVNRKLNSASNLDQIDTVTFGLETDDGLVVKVYVAEPDANKFEIAMAEMLGSVDDIEEALNRLDKDINIVDVVWPDDIDEEDSDDDFDSDEVLDKKVYSKKNLGKEEVKEFKNLTFGQMLSNNLVEGSSGSIADLLQTIPQHLVYEAIINLGVPELALDRSPYRTQIIKGIRATAAEVQKNSQMRVALKTFVKLQISDDSKKEGEKESEKIKEDLELNSTSAPPTLFLKSLISIINLLDVTPDKTIASIIFENSKFKLLEARSAMHLRPILTPGIINKLKKFNIALVGQQQQNESLMLGDINSILIKMINMCDDDSKSIATAIINLQAWNLFKENEKEYPSSIKKKNLAD